MKAKDSRVKCIYVGKVVSDKMDKTIVVKFDRIYKHRRFHKYLRRSKKYKVHDESNEAKVGDTIEFYEGRPVSKTKYMYFARVMKAQ